MLLGFVALLTLAVANAVGGGGGRRNRRRPLGLRAASDNANNNRANGNAAAITSDGEIPTSFMAALYQVVDSAVETGSEPSVAFTHRQAIRVLLMVYGILLGWDNETQFWSPRYLTAVQAVTDFKTRYLKALRDVCIHIYSGQPAEYIAAAISHHDFIDTLLTDLQEGDSTGNGDYYQTPGLAVSELFRIHGFAGHPHLELQLLVDPGSGGGHNSGEN